MLVAADYLAELFAQYEDLGMVLMVYSGDSGAEAFARIRTQTIQCADPLRHRHHVLCTDSLHIYLL